MATKRVLVIIKGGKQRRKKNKGWGGREIIVVIDRFVIATCGGDQKVFHCHVQVAIEKFLVTIIAW